MKDGKNRDENSKNLDIDDLGNVSGGYAGSDKYTVGVYKQYGILHEHNYWSKDKYTDLFMGENIDQKTAESRVAKRMAYESSKHRSWKKAHTHEIC